MFSREIKIHFLTIIRPTSHMVFQIMELKLSQSDGRNIFLFDLDDDDDIVSGDSSIQLKTFICHYVINLFLAEINKD